MSQEKSLDNKIHVVSLNMHKGTGWFTRKSTLDRLREQIRQLEPDLILLQETQGTQFEFIAEEIWPHFSYGMNVSKDNGHHGNAILSKFPIVFSNNIDISKGSYERRGLLHTIIERPSCNSRVHLLCVHLGLFKNDRLKQLAQIVEYINAEIPLNDFLILGGDFNDLGSHATAPLVEGLGLQETFLHFHGSYAKTFPAWAPLLRLDRIYCRGFDVHHARCLTDRAWKILSDHIAIEVFLNLKLSTI